MGSFGKHSQAHAKKRKLESPSGSAHPDIPEQLAKHSKQTQVNGIHASGHSGGDMQVAEPARGLIKESGCEVPVPLVVESLTMESPSDCPPC